jgi:hypothetical protein
VLIQKAARIIVDHEQGARIEHVVHVSVSDASSSPRASPANDWESQYEGKGSGLGRLFSHEDVLIRITLRYPQCLIFFPFAGDGKSCGRVLL